VDISHSPSLPSTIFVRPVVERSVLERPAAIHAGACPGVGLTSFGPAIESTSAWNHLLDDVVAGATRV